MKSIALALLLATSVVGLVGCGQKGPLFLPGQNPNPPKPLLKNSHATGVPADATSSDNRQSTPATNDPAATDQPGDAPAPDTSR